jgi:hypothetical protein
MTPLTFRSCKSAVIFSLAGISLLPAFGQSLSTQSAMHVRIVSLYNFSPATVTAEVRESKSKEMDAFWGEVTKNKDAELPLLRIELQNSANPSFFFDDASNLLLSLSQLQEDRQIAAAAISRTDLKDVESHHYLFEVHALAVKGVNVTPAAFRMLDDPKFEVFLPEHGAYRLDQSACLLEALLPLPTSVWLSAVIERARTERDPQAMKTLLLLLFYAQTSQSDRLIQSTAADVAVPMEVRDFAGTIVKHEKQLGIGRQPSKAAEAKLREERRTRMFAVSDEAMDDLDELTTKIAKARTLDSQIP